MKKLFFAVVAAVFAMVSFTSCDKDNDLPIDFKTLPKAAQTTIVEHFGEDKVMLVLHDKEFLNGEYVVTLFDGTIIEFDKNGAWESIEALAVGVPESIIPAKIAEYLATNFAGQKVRELDKDKDGYEVKLEGNIELEFNLSGVLVNADVD